jgi:transcriptional regulator with XRE-family HTH domain
MPARQAPPEAKLIASARQALVPRVSMRQAAERAGISPTRWRQLEAGVIRVRGKDYPEVAPAETLARMALAVGVSPSSLVAAGRGDAAAITAVLAGRDWREEELRDLGADRGGFLEADEVERLVARYRERRGPPETRAGLA